MEVFVISENFDTKNKKIAAFDYDWTLVKPKESRTFPKDVDDWQWLRPNVPIVLKKYHDEGYSLYVITNQTKQWKLDHIKNSLGTLGLPIKVIVGIGGIAKPDPRLFTVPFDRTKSFFCGDAAGRANDWSNSDLIFANNVGIKFKIPEECFPIELTKKEDCVDYQNDKLEMVVMVGYPAAGKSTFAQTKLKSNIIVSGDELKTIPKMLKRAKRHLDMGNSVTIDATNGKIENRAKLIEFARKCGIYVRCIEITTSIEEAMEWNTVRSNETGKKVPKIAFYAYRKSYTKPTVEEGFDEVIYVF